MTHLAGGSRLHSGTIKLSYETIIVGSAMLIGGVLIQCLPVSGALESLEALFAFDSLSGRVLHRASVLLDTHSLFQYRGRLHSSLTAFNCEVGPFLTSFALRSRFCWALAPFPMTVEFNALC